MIQRVVFGVFVTAPLLACSTTTSLGGPAQTFAAATAEEGDGDADSEAGATPDDTDSTPSGGGIVCVGRGYTWLPESSTTACQYLLPSGSPDNDPDYDPATWSVDRVWIETWIPGQQPEYFGGYVGSGDACGGMHGWFYVPTSEGTPTAFELCPESCAFAAQEGAELRLSAYKPSCD